MALTERREAALHDHARHTGAWPWFYWPARAVLEPLLRAWHRPQVEGWEHVPTSGPLIVAANHTMLFDPLLVCGAFREPLAHMAKSEVFESRFTAFFLARVGAFPVRRGARDQRALETAVTVLRGGRVLLVLPEGTRVRGDRLGEPRPGVGWLALAAGSPVLPLALRPDPARPGRPWPGRMRARFGAPIPAPQLPDSSPSWADAAAHTAVVWDAVSDLWTAAGAAAASS